MKEFSRRKLLAVYAMCIPAGAGLAVLGHHMSWNWFLVCSALTVALIVTGGLLWALETPKENTEP